MVLERGDDESSKFQGTSVRPTSSKEAPISPDRIGIFDKLQAGEGEGKGTVGRSHPANAAEPAGGTSRVRIGRTGNHARPLWLRSLLESREPGSVAPRETSMKAPSSNLQVP